LLELDEVSVDVMALAHALNIPSLEELLARAASNAHAALIAIYGRMLEDKSVGKTRKQSMEIGGWGMTSQRQKEAAGQLQSWNDGTIVRVSTVALYLHILDLIVASHPADGPPRKARTPTKPYRKGHRRQSPDSGRKEGSPA
jgi:hypothetical protein